MGKTYRAAGGWHPRADFVPKTNLQFSNGNPHGCGISVMQKTHKRVVDNIRRIFDSPYIEDPNNIRAVLSLNPKTGISVAPDKEIEGLKTFEVAGGKFVARALSNISTDGTEITRIIVPYSRTNEWEPALVTMMELGMAEKVFQLRDFILSPEFINSGITLHHSIRGANPSYPMLAGTYKHYTNQQGYEGIRESGSIKGSWKEEKSRRDFFVYLTTLTVQPEEASFIFWTRGERQLMDGRSDYVVCFNIKKHAPIKVDYAKDDPFVECWVQTPSLSLDDIEVVYIGKNDSEEFERSGIVLCNA